MTFYSDFYLVWPEGVRVQRPRGKVHGLVYGLDPFPVVQALPQEAFFICEGCGLFLPLSDYGHNDARGTELCRDCWEDLAAEV